MIVYKLLAILLCLTNLPFGSHGIVVTEENLPEILRRKVSIPDRVSPITVGDLYGPTVTINNFHPGELLLNVLDQPESDRIIHYTRANPLAAKNTPCILTRNIANGLKKLESNEDNLILIKGDPMAGKTTAMRMFQYSAINKLPTLTVFVDFPNFVKPSNMDDLSLDYILKASIEDKYLDFVRDLIKVNPSAVTMLFDGVDQVPHAQDKILSVIYESFTHKLPTIMSSSTDIRQKLLSSYYMYPHTVHLSSALSMEEFIKFHNVYWAQKFNWNYDFRAPVLPSYTRSENYGIALYLLLAETPLPHSIAATKVVLEYTEDKNVLRPFVTAPEYFQGGLSHIPRDLLKLSDKMNFPKMRYYDKLLKDHSSLIEVYGPQALNQIFISNIIKSEFKSSLEFSKKEILKNTQDAYKLLRFKDYGLNDFVHDEYKRYFAAKYVLNSLNTETPLIRCFKEIITSADHIFVLEFINSVMNDMEYIQYTKKIPHLLSSEMASSPDFAAIVTDNLIEHRLDNLCFKMFELMGESRLKEYLNAPITLQSRNKYSFGMLSEVRDVIDDDYFPRKTIWQFSGTRMELVIHLELVQSHLAIRNFGITIDPSIGLVYAARQSLGHLNSYVMWHKGPYSTEDLNRAVLESVRALGPNSVSIITRLHAAGAQPSAIDGDGRILVHEAARWLSVPLLQYINRNLQIPLIDSPDANGQTILFKMLEHGMPFNVFDVGTAWPAMEYFIQHGDLSVNTRVINSLVPECLQYNPNRMEILNKPYKDLLKFSELSTSRKIYLRYIFKYFMTFQEVDIPRAYLEIRTKLIIKKSALMIRNTHSMIAALMKQLNKIDSLTLSEIIISHGSSVKAFTSRQLYESYKGVVRHLLMKEAPLFNRAQIDRVALALSKNMVTSGEMNDIMIIVKTEVQPVVFDPIEFDMKLIFSKRMHEQLPVLESNDQLDTIVLQTPYDIEPEMSMNDRIETQLVERYFHHDEGFPDPDVFESFACHYSSIL